MINNPETPQNGLSSLEQDAVNLDWLIFERLCDRVMPDGVSEAAFGAHVPLLKDSRLSVGKLDIVEKQELGVSVPVRIVLTELSDTENGAKSIRFTIESTDAQLLMGRPVAQNFDFPTVEPGHLGDMFHGFILTLGEDQSVALRGVNSLGEEVPFQTDESRDDDFPAVRKLALACAQAVQPTSDGRSKRLTNSSSSIAG